MLIHVNVFKNPLSIKLDKINKMEKMTVKIKMEITLLYSIILIILTIDI